MLNQAPSNKAEKTKRADIFDTYSKTDLTDLSPQQVLEFILLYIFPRGDVSGLARRLLERFGTVQNVLEANRHSLVQIEGINDRSADMLCGFVEIFDFYTNSKSAKNCKLTEWNDIYDLCENLVRFQSREVLYIIGLDQSFRKLGQRKLGTGTSATVSSSPNLICDFINETKAKYVILTHNHPGGSCKPSVADKTTNDKIKDIVKIMHSKFIDHIIVGSDGIFSLQFGKQVRTFSNDLK